MGFYLSLPLIFFKFWFLEAPIALLSYFGSLNHAFFQLFSLPLFIRTFFRPLKNEYRKGLVAFSIGMGIFVKTILIFVDLLLFFLLVAFEVLVIVGFVILPFAAVIVPFT